MRCHWLHRHPRMVVLLTIQGVTIRLNPWENLVMDTSLNIGHTVSVAIAYFDQHGNPMLVEPKPDTAPVPAWTNTTSATETLAVSADGLSCVGTPIAVGTDVISLALSVGGVMYSATLGVTVTAEPQVFTSIGLVPTVSA